MSVLPAPCRVVIAAVLCAGLALPALGFGAAIGQASALPAPMDDPAAPPAPAPDPSTIVNEANTILPMISQIAQFLPSFLDPNAAPTYTSGVQPRMLSPFVPGS